MPPYTYIISLTIYDVRQGDFGNYSCVARNSLGTVKGNVSLRSEYYSKPISVLPEGNFFISLGLREPERPKTTTAPPPPPTVHIENNERYTKRNRNKNRNNFDDSIYYMSTTETGFYNGYPTRPSYSLGGFDSEI